MNRLVFRNDAPVFIPHLYDTFHAERRKDGSMYTQTAFPVIDLAGTGRSIERHRRDAGLTVRDLQTYFGFEYPQAIYKWQHGECLPTVDNLLALAKLLQVSMEDLLVYEDQGLSFFVFSLFKQNTPCFLRKQGVTDELRGCRISHQHYFFHIAFSIEKGSTARA